MIRAWVQILLPPPFIWRDLATLMYNYVYMLTSVEIIDCYMLSQKHNICIDPGKVTLRHFIFGPLAQQVRAVYS